MSARAVRCAIYTRKSSEEGLEQDFNSLHAQREACEAYIQSQRHEGWQVLPEAYDDGGYSGGTMERPALSALLEAIRNKQIDTVVVYKVDRLTRSLHDFARMVDIFDSQGVSFVSVTQQFNTTTSMGRLTLNVLLSFAQFEREVTSERIRDKIAASAKKGIWMGGCLPHGYYVQDRRLHIDETQAADVRTIFSLYQEHRCVRLTKAEVDARGITTRTGKRFSQGNLYNILQNPIYLGQIRHKGQRYPGQHEAIIDQLQWDAVQTIIAENRVKRHHQTNAKAPSLLSGLLYNEAGLKYKPGQGSKNGRRYRYYNERHPEDEKTEAPRKRRRRIPAGDIDTLVLNELDALLRSTDRLCEAAALEQPSIDDMQLLQYRGEHLAAKLAEGDMNQQRVLVYELVQKVLLTTDQMSITVNRQALREALEVRAATTELEGATYTVDMPIQLRTRGVEIRLITETNHESENWDVPLIKAIVRAHEWYHWLLEGKFASISDLARHENVTDRYIRHIIDLAFLSPQLVEQALTGQQPVDVSAETLIKMNGLPCDWTRQ